MTTERPPLSSLQPGRFNCTISISRNVGPTQLSRPVWDDFKDHIDRVAADIIDLSNFGAQVVQRGTVRGTWNGVPEESFTLTVAGTDPTNTVYAEQGDEQGDHTLRTFIGADLADLAKRYGQDSIAFTFYVPEFV